MLRGNELATWHHNSVDQNGYKQIDGKKIRVSRAISKTHNAL